MLACGISCSFAKKAIFHYPELSFSCSRIIIKNQLQEAIMTDQWSLKEFVVLFTGNGRENGK